MKYRNQSAFKSALHLRFYSQIPDIKEKKKVITKAANRHIETMQQRTHKRGS